MAFFKNAKYAYNDSDNDNDTDNESDNVNDSDSDNVCLSKKEKVKGVSKLEVPLYYY